MLRAFHPYRCAIYLFGSRARGTAGRTSDIDVAVLPHEPVPAFVFSRVREAVEESTVPYLVEIIDLRDVDEAFRDRVVREGVLWTESASA